MGMSPITGAVAMPLQVSTITDTINQTVADVIRHLATLLGALVILIVGYTVGQYLHDTPLESLGD